MTLSKVAQGHSEMNKFNGGRLWKVSHNWTDREIFSVPHAG